MVEQMQNLKVLATYPFLSDARSYVKEMGVSVENLLTNLAYERARIFGIERLEKALKNRNVGDRRLVDESDYISEILSYPIARMIVVCIGDRYFLRRYALAEAVHAYHHLRNEPPEFLAYVGNDLGLSIKQDGGISIHFLDYLKFTPTRYREWKMVNRSLNKGFVSISYRDLARIIQEFLRIRIGEELEKRKCSEIVTEVFREEIEYFRNKVMLERKKRKTQPIGKLSITKLPPCMKNILTAIQAGENVPHMGRFALVAFLSSLGLKNEEILKMFITAPDYDDDRARYQVEHITGKRSSTKYAPPGCDKMRTYGLCPEESRKNEICRGVKNPVSYYRVASSREKRK